MAAQKSPLKTRFPIISKVSDLLVILVLASCLLAGSLTFQQYGVSWDEPRFYQYANSIRHAYSFPDWMRGNLDISKVFGPIPDDLPFYGPAYLLLGRAVVGVLYKITYIKLLTLWHWVNFISFLAGSGFFYLLCKRWMKAWAALFATLLLISQPLLWGHAFINPKDIPCLVFFMGSIYFGFRMIDRLAVQIPEPSPVLSRKSLPSFRQLLPRFSIYWFYILPAGLILGMAISIRVVGLLAGLLVLFYFLLKGERRSLNAVFIYVLTAISVLYISWPYIWDNPIGKFVKVTLHMSNFQVTGSVLFNGVLYPAIDLPRSYLPTLLAFTLTEPAWLLSFAGIAAVFYRLRHGQIEWKTLFPIFLWLSIPVMYILVSNPPQYDGYRHFLFILPPVFILAGIGFQQILEYLQPVWSRMVLVVVLLLPGILGIVQTHPYEYTYYNSLARMTGGISRRFETDYWLTCYKEAIGYLNQQGKEEKTVYVNWNPDLAYQYADDEVHVRPLDLETETPPPGTFLLLTTRENSDLGIYPDDPILFSVGRDGAVFCILKGIK
jgi:hypothetical protein